VGSNPTRRIHIRFGLRSKEEVALVKALANEGLNHCEIARATGIPRGTVRDWLTGRKPRHARRDSCPACGHPPHDFDLLPGASYAYLLGMYLGDGCISKGPRDVYRLRISLCTDYPNIMSECIEAIRVISPNNRVGLRFDPASRVSEAYSCSRQWPCFFPQHGPGRKHLRRIELSSWQQAIARRHPESLLRGLIHSDGCRCMNRVNGKQYPRYFFSNRSSDIKAIFCAACDRLGVRWTRSSRKEISIARASSVALLDSFVGPKS
jgi:hypothetical protein